MQRLASALVPLQILKESFKLYRAINDGIINLVDKVVHFIEEPATGSELSAFGLYAWRKG